MPMVMLGPEVDGDVDTTSETESQTKNKMFSYGKELCFLFALLFTSYAALHSPPPKVSKTPAAVRFFRQNSVVDDYYLGNLNAALEQITQAELSFVMYYAPWDAESQKVRWHFEAVARYYHKQIYFAAINCWQPGSECRQQYSKIPTFPVLMLYPLHHSGLQYRGVREVSYMIQFLSTALRPVERLTSPQDLLFKMSKHDATVVGFFDFDQDSTKVTKLYKAFHNAAIGFLERDPLQEILFSSVISSETAADFEVETYEMPSIRLYLWNESVTLSEPLSSWSGENISQWVLQSLHQVAVWVQPPGSKSLTLSSYLQEGSIMIMFTPRNPLLPRSYYYDLLRETALEFFDCNNSEWVSQVSNLMWSERQETSSKYFNMLRDCALWRKFRGQEGGVAPVLSVQRDPTMIPHEWGNSSYVCQHEQEEALTPPKTSFDYGYCGLLNYESDRNLPKEHIKKMGSSGWRSYFGFDRGDKTFEPVDLRRLKKLKHQMSNGLTSMLIGTNDMLSAENLETQVKDEVCRELRHARLLDRPHYPEPENNSVSDRERPNVRGLACSSNSTLSFLAMDSLQLHQFAEGLGVDVLHRKDKSAVLIINPQQESQYLLQGDINKESLVRFIKSYVNNTLPRWLRTTSLKPRSLGFSFGPTQTIHLSRYTERVVRNCPDTTVCVPEISSSTFSSEVLENRKNVVLMYHTPYCAFCSGVSHVFLTVARTLQSISTLQFARIDGDNNDLPWEFTVHRFPSIIYFPAKRKSESRIYPSHLQVTVPNLVKFILSNLTPEERVLALLVICEQGSSRRPLSYQDQLGVDKCMTQVKIEVLQAAGQLVKKYRFFILNWGENPVPIEYLQLRRNIQRSLTARLRFFRLATSTLISATLSSSENNPPITISEALKQIRDAFSTTMYSENASVSDVPFKQNADLQDVKEKLGKLSRSLEQAFVETVSHDVKHGKGEL